MENNRKSGKLDSTLLILAALVLVAVAVAVGQGGWQLTLQGFIRAGSLFQEVWLRLILGLTLGGLVQVLIPRALIAKWLGHAAGFKGILIGSYIGILMPGGPFIMLPIVASIYRAGAGVGPIIALLTGRALLGLQMLIVWQIPFLGVEIPLARYITCLFLPPLVGLAGRAILQVIAGRSPEAGALDDGIALPGRPPNEAEKNPVPPDKGEGEKWT